MKRTDSHEEEVFNDINVDADGVCHDADGHVDDICGRRKPDHDGGEEALQYTTEGALAEIMRRSEVIVLRRNHRACRILSGVAGALFAMLVLVIALLPRKASIRYNGSMYGSFLLSQEAGGYVLAAVIAFALGVVITLLCLRYKKRKRSHEEGCHSDE